jgi:hypothetical protein
MKLWTSLIPYAELQYDNVVIRDSEAVLPNDLTAENGLGGTGCPHIRCQRNSPRLLSLPWERFPGIRCFGHSLGLASGNSFHLSQEADIAYYNYISTT